MSIERVFWVVLLCSFLGFGGSGAIPVLRAQLAGAVPDSDTLVLHSLAVGNVSPGPNGLFLVAVAYFVAGLPGALVAVVAICIPPLLVTDACWTSVAVVALLCTSTATLVQHASVTTLGLVMVVTGALMLATRVPAALAVAVAIAVGLVF